MTKKNKQIVAIATAILILGTLVTIGATMAGAPTSPPTPAESPTLIILDPPAPTATTAPPTERDDIPATDIEMLAKTVWGEARGCSPDEWQKWQAGEEPFTLAPYATETPYLFFEGDGKHNWYRRDWR